MKTSKDVPRKDLKTFLLLKRQRSKYKIVGQKLAARFMDVTQSPEICTIFC